MQIIEMAVSALRPYGKNPRKNAEAVKYVANSIREFGFKVPIVIDRNNVIVCGHTRLFAAKRLKMGTVPCILADDLSDEQIRAFRLADNKTAEFASWDDDLLALEIADLGLDLTPFGFEVMEAPKQVTEDDAPAVEEATTTRRGDVFILGEHRLMCGDSTNGTDVGLLMQGGHADMIFTDPPYNVDYNGKSTFLNAVGKPCCVERDIEGDYYKTDAECAEKLWRPAFQNMRTFASDDCSMYMAMSGGGIHMMLMLRTMDETGWPPRHEIIWAKNNHVLGRADYNYKHEPIIYTWAKRHKFYGRGEFKTTTWEIDKPLRNDLHPTMKPIRLIVNALLNSSREDDIVMDLFGGSGSTLIACEQTNRRCYMMEIDAHYVDVIVRRWESFTGRKAEKIQT